MLSLTTLLSGCFKDDTVSPFNVSALSGGEQTAGSTTGTEGGSAPPPPPPPPNSKPTISGTPVTSILAGEAYSFKPLAKDPDGDDLTFSVANKPAWATFDSKTGRLAGTPGAGDVGTYSSVRISVTDGKDSAQLSAFTISVEQVVYGSATLSWTPPTENTDGTVLTDLAGYKIYYGRTKDSLTEVVDVGQAGITSYVIENLSPATWYFSMTSYNDSGIESNRTEVVSKTVS